MKIILSKNSKIQGLITKDLLQLKTYKRTLISFILIFSITTIIQLLSGGGNDLLSLLVLVCLVLLVSIMMKPPKQTDILEAYQLA